MKTSTSYPFWSVNNFAISTPKLTRYLGSIGFGRYQTTKGASASWLTFRNQGNLLEIHDANSVKRVLTKTIEVDKDLDETEKETLMDKIIRITPSTFSNFLSHLPAWSTEGFEGTSELKVFKDTHNACHIPFKNGIVRVTADAIELLPYEILEDGCIWSSSRLDHSISLFPGNIVPDGIPQVFRDFVHFALKTDQSPNVNDLKEKYTAGTDSKKFKDTKRAFETAYGYLIHDFNPVDDMKMVVFADIESSATRAEGRNGKSLTMKTLEWYKKSTFIDGKMFRKSINESARFNFSSVSVDSRLVIINDLNPDLDLTQLFSQISDDFTIEGKGTNKIVIPFDKKPKMCCNTNYVLSGSGASYAGRQHIVEFGNYFNRCERLNIKPKDILGKKIGGADFTEADWNAFYSYGFHCVQLYLKEGLFKTQNSSYELKNLVRTIEGENGTGELTEWVMNWCLSTRKANDHHIDGISEEELYSSFITDNPELAITWSKKNFCSAVFTFATTVEGYDCNPQNSSKGNTKSARKWRKGPQGAQEYFLRITHVSDA
jgi:hypothetical protein